MHCAHKRFISNGFTNSKETGLIQAGRVNRPNPPSSHPIHDILAEGCTIVDVTSMDFVEFKRHQTPRGCFTASKRGYLSIPMFMVTYLIYAEAIQFAP